MTPLQDKCRASGLKMTAPRQAILQILDTSQNHPSAEKIYEKAKDLCPSLSLATVYRTLKILEDHEIITRLHIVGDKSRYETADCDHHDHLIDMDTGKIFEFENEVIEQIQQEIADKLGYDLVGHRLELYGRKKK